MNVKSSFELVVDKHALVGIFKPGSLVTTRKTVRFMALLVWMVISLVKLLRAQIEITTTTTTFICVKLPRKKKPFSIAASGSLLSPLEQLFV